MTRQRDPTDLPDTEWRVLEPHWPAPNGVGRPRRHAVRDILRAMFSIRRSGCTWRLLPHDLPPWPRVSHDARLWRVPGRWERLHAVLHRAVRRQGGRDPQPRAAMIDSPAGKTALVGGPRGDDGGKTVNGRQRHVLVDTPGVLIRALVHPADLVDRDTAPSCCGHRCKASCPACSRSGLIAHTLAQALSGCTRPGVGRWSSSSTGGPESAGAGWDQARHPHRFRGAFMCCRAGGSSNAHSPGC
jgi:transposase